jgi:RNA polymerase sigma factor (sigma-70 family)
MIDTRPDGETLVGRATQAFTRYQAGEREALDELVAVVTPLLWRTVRGAGLDTATAEDVIQTVWLGLLRGAESVRDPRTIVKWLITCARREAWRTAKRSRVDAGRVAGVIGVDADELLPARDDPHMLPDETVLRDTRQRQLWEHVRRLPERCIQLLGVIAFADRPDYAVLADALGMPVGSIGPTRGRCLAKLRDRLRTDPLWEGHL